MVRAAAIDEDAVVRGYESGESLRDLAATFGVSTRPIQRILRQHGVPPRTAPRGPDRAPRRRRATARNADSFSGAERAEVAQRFLSGETQLALATEYGCGASTIARVLRAAGVPAGEHGQMRERHHAWKGGRITHASGYTMIRPDPTDVIAAAMKTTSGYVLEHRLAMAQSLGRPLDRREQVHHVNGDKLDNRLENLQLRNGPHGKGTALRCRQCGSHDIEATDLDG